MLQATLLGLFGVLLAASLLGLLWGGDRTRGPRGALTLLTALVVLLLLIRPLASLLRGDLGLSFDKELTVGDLEAQYQQVFEETLAARGESDLIEGIHGLLETRHQIARKDASVRVLFDSDGVLDSVRITLQGKALLRDPRSIQNDFENLLKCNVEVR